jgi:hypothetical protein
VELASTQETDERPGLAEEPLISYTLQVAPASVVTTAYSGLGFGFTMAAITTQVFAFGHEIAPPSEPNTGRPPPGTVVGALSLDQLRPEVLVE